MNENEWIAHDGSDICPIQWASEGEYEVKIRRGDVSGIGRAKTWHWDELGLASIVAYRLTDGWVPVVDGRCPIKAASGEWQYRQHNGHESISTWGSTDDPDYWKDCSESEKIVAVRHIHSIDVDIEAQKVHTLPERVQENEKSEHAATIQKELEGIADDIREIYRPLSQNEVMKIAGDAINGTRIGEVVTVDREVFAALTKQ